ncbi:MAG: glycosyltransferase [Bacteroidales bacterium]
MKVISINTSAGTGGAAIAARRIAEALNQIPGVEVAMLVRDGDSNFPVVTTTRSRWKRYLNFFRFAYERLIFFLHERSPQVRFLFSLANTGEEISRHPLVQQADIIHLHWINGGFVSLKGIKKLIDLGKPVVWTLHDMWLFTGGCHHSGDCTNFTQQCGNCMFLKKPYRHDLSSRVWRRKQAILPPAGNLTLVTCSQWLRERATISSLLIGKTVHAIPNPIDTETYRPIDKEKYRKQLGLNPLKKYILFVAANVNNYFKGFSYFVESVEILTKQNPEICHSVEILIAGKVKDPNVFRPLSVPYRLLGIVSTDSMLTVYNAADLYVTSSLQENLPNTVMESLACGLPVVAFKVGGIPEMIEHRQNGWLAEFKSASSLAEGIRWCLFETDYAKLSINAREKVLREYTYKIVAEKYLNVFEIAMNPKK